MSKIDWRDVIERAAKTAVQGAILVAIPLLPDIVQNPTEAAIAAFLGAVGGAALSAAWNVIEDAVKKPAPPEPPTPLFP